MLEVRNNDWTQESIENYKKFLKHIFEDRLNDCNNDINTMAETLNDDRKQILDKTYSLSAIVQESSASCEEVNASCEEFIATVQTMCNNINEVKNKSESLNNSVKVFKI